jgi:hypothetical protein
MASRRGIVAKTATESLKFLWEDGFFRGWKGKAAIDATLSKNGNHFSDPELGMALKRAKHLTRKGKRHSYVYIQKYPYVAQDTVKTPRKKA